MLDLSVIDVFLKKIVGMSLVTYMSLVTIIDILNCTKGINNYTKKGANSKFDIGFLIIRIFRFRRIRTYNF